MRGPWLLVRFGNQMQTKPRETQKKKQKSFIQNSKIRQLENHYNENYFRSARSNMKNN